MPRRKAHLLKKAEQCVKNCGNNGKKVDSQNDCNQSSFEATNKDFFFVLNQPNSQENLIGFDSTHSDCLEKNNKEKDIVSNHSNSQENLIEPNLLI